MVDFRYHIVSLIAVFLALGIGIVMGTTVIDRAIVSRLEGDLDRLNEKVKEERAAKDAAEGELDQFNEFADQGAKFFVANRLAGQTVTVISIAGTPQKQVDDVVRIMRLAGASVPAVVTFTGKWTLDEQTARDQLALFTGAPDSEAATVRDYAIANLAVKLGGAQLAAEQQAMVKPEVQSTLLGRLEDDGFIEIVGQDVQAGLDPDTLGGANTLAVIVDGGDIREALLEDFYIPFTLEMALGGSSEAVEGESDDEQFVLAVRSDAQAAALMSTVDNINTRIGLFVSVIALEQQLSGIYEHLGTGAGADTLLPERISQ